MIFAAPGETFQTDLSNAPAGLVGTVGVRILKDDSGATVVARTTAGIIELVAGSGVYRANLVAPNTAGDYTVFWDDGTVTPSTTATEDLTVSATQAAEQKIATGATGEPTINEVSALIETRTRDTRSGALIGTFNTKTRPTEEQAQKAINDAMNDVRSDLGVEEIPAQAAGEVKSLVALVAAMKIELSYYTEQVETNKSPYKSFEKQYERRLPRVEKAVERIIEGDLEGTETELLPQYNFPDGSDSQGMIGWGTILG